MRAGQGTAIAVTGAGHGEDCHHHGRPFAAAGSGASICGLPTIHCALVEPSDGEGYILVWSHDRRQSARVRP
jgi:hypothetical protein